MLQDRGTRWPYFNVAEIADRNAIDAGIERNLRQYGDHRLLEQVIAITLPEVGKAFVSDNLSLTAAERGGFKASVNLGKLISVLSQSAESAAGTDPFSELTVATGGAQFPSENRTSWNRPLPQSASMREGHIN